MGEKSKKLSGKIHAFARFIRLEKWSKFTVYIFAGLVIFILGLGVGDGQISIGLTSGNNNNLPERLNYSSVNEVYQALKNNYNGKLTTNQLLDGLKEGLAESTGDPYTEYFNAQQAQSFTNELNNSFSGIGAELGQDSDGNLEVIAPISGSPAAKAGIEPKDLITEIDGQSTSGMPVDIAVNKIRGPSGTNVHLSIVRNHSQVLQFTITRANIQVPSV